MSQLPLLVGCLYGNNSIKVHPKYSFPAVVVLIALMYVEVNMLPISLVLHKGCMDNF